MKLLFTLLAFLICACSNSEGDSASQQTSPVEFSEDSLSGMLRVKATGAVAVLGTNSEEARVNERPAMLVKFYYDFLLGQHEVTCAEFDSLMSFATGLALNCENDEFPAINVTYYDAVLFANERSKAEGFDTAYTYVNATFDNEKHCTNLEGFAYYPEVDAYRLPSEAEWVLVAHQAWNLDSAWTAQNSDYKLHVVCSIGKMSGLCDMAGNAMEWVNDWLGNFRDTILDNYVGAPDGGALGQRILKGGSFRNALESISLYSRGDVYTVTSSTRADYVGFRLAFGKIPNAVWMGTNGKVNSSRVVPLANSSTIRTLVGSYKAKLAFRNDISGNLDYIDYSSGVISVVEIADTLEVYHPDISPNGKLVAFCTGMEGVSGLSSVYVRNLDAGGSNLVKLDVESAAIPRWRVLENGDTTIVYVTDAGNNRDETTFKNTSTWQVKFSKGKFGKPQKLFDGAYHDGISDDNTLAVTGARLLRARLANSGSSIVNSGRDTVWYKNGENAEQACNVSLSKDGSKRVLFLDFGGKTGNAFAGESYGTHERLLIADSAGNLVQIVAAPSGYTFDHSEWVNGAENKAVATLANSNGSHQKIVVIDLSDSSVSELVSGDELWHPNLWVAGKSVDVENENLDLDSAGVYMNPDDEWGPVLMRYNMELLWRFRDSANVAIIGSSRPLYSISPKAFSPEFFAVNFAHTPNSIYASRDYLDKYLIPHLKNLKYVVVSLDIDFWHKIDGPESDNFFVVTYKKYPGYLYDENHGYWSDGYPKGLLEATENSISVTEAQSYLEDRGRYTATYCITWGDPPAIDADSTYFDDKMYFIENSLDALKNIIEICLNRNIYVVGMIFPQNPRYKDTGIFGRYGMRRSLAKSLIDQFHELERIYPNFTLFDENKMGAHDYTDMEAVDSDHLCYNGAPKITARLDSVLKSLK
ncbi:TIGR02171 family lipoprotein [Fibrobacter sp.]|uniref:TIGR02171 family lipoprotein n=1 Tax=Fibrobacter sp. TaxID=35828 RepID=UPI003862FBC5